MLLSSLAAGLGWTLASFDHINSDFYMLKQPLRLNWGRGGLSLKASHCYSADQTPLVNL